MPKQKITKEEIVVKCMQVFREKGYANTSIQDLADATNLSKSLFYHHYKNKDELLLESIRLYKSYFKKHIFDISDLDLKKEERLGIMVKNAKDAFSKDTHGCLMGNLSIELASLNEKLKLEVVDFFSDWENAMYKVVTRDRNKAIEVVQLIQGALLLSKINSDTKYILRSLDNLTHHN